MTKWKIGHGFCIFNSCEEGNIAAGVVCIKRAPDKLLSYTHHSKREKPCALFCHVTLEMLSMWIVPKQISAHLEDKLLDANQIKWYPRTPVYHINFHVSFPLGKNKCSFTLRSEYREGSLASCQHSGMLEKKCATFVVPICINLRRYLKEEFWNP